MTGPQKKQAFSHLLGFGMTSAVRNLSQPVAEILFKKSALTKRKFIGFLLA